MQGTLDIFNDGEGGFFFYVGEETWEKYIRVDASDLRRLRARINGELNKNVGIPMLQVDVEYDGPEQAALN